MADLTQVMAGQGAQNAQLGSTLSAQGAQLGQQTSNMISDNMKMQAMRQEQQTRIDQMGGATMDVYMQHAKKSSAAKKNVTDILAQMEALPAHENKKYTDYEMVTGAMARDANTPAREGDTEAEAARAKLQAELDKAMAAKENADNIRNDYVMNIIRNPSLVGILNNMSMADEDIQNTMFNEDVYSSLSQPEKDEWGARWTMYREIERKAAAEKAGIAAASEMAMEKYKSDLKIKETEAENASPGSLERAKNFSNIGTTYQNVIDSMYGSASKGLKAIGTNLGSIDGDIEAMYRNDPVKAQDERDHVDKVLNTIVSENLSHKEIQELLRKNYEAAVSQGYFDVDSPFANVYRAIQMAAENRGTKKKLGEAVEKMYTGTTAEGN